MESVKHLVRCNFYERKRRELTDAVVAEVGREAWDSSGAGAGDRMALLLGMGEVNRRC